MTWSVRQLGSRGSIDALKVPQLGVVGVLTIDYFIDQRTGYPRKTARVVAVVGPATGQDLLCPLFEPEILRLDRDGMFLKGRQPSTIGSGEDVQIWRCQQLHVDS